MKQFFLFGLTLCCFPIFAAGINESDDTYSTENRIFYIERSKNKNIVCYDFNIDNSGKLNAQEPISVYWINREEYPGKQGTLSFFQRKMAYGYSVVKQEYETIIIKLNAVKTKQLVIGKEGTSLFCRTDINNQLATITKIYVKTKDNNSMRVEYVDIYGYNLTTGDFITERITP